MKVKILPSTASGAISAPPSKSASHRALIAGALSEHSTIYNLGESDDINATLSCLKTMGAEIYKFPDRIEIGGLDPKKIPGCTVDCGESGSTLRFLIPLCLMSGNPVTFVGHGRLMQRPLTEYEQLCRENGFDYILRENTLTVCGELHGNEYRMSGERSSQFITGMLYALSSLGEKSSLEITGNAQSLSYIALTAQILDDFGVDFVREGNKFYFGGGQRFNSREYAVEGDYSNAAFLDAFNLIGGNVAVGGLREDSLQGDKIYREYFRRLGTAEIMDLSDCPDLAPVLFALAGIYGGKFTGTQRLRMKESDRTEAMKCELRKCGVELIDTENEVTIPAAEIHPPTEIICGHNDHRIVMAMSVLLSKTGGTIEGAEAVSKSWPSFFEEIRRLGIHIAYE